ncbi:hypothetical protein H0E87_016524 [Populus deltoides]|uniref:Uncharacterized protein n=1 Tax=Populus deltoides TaxID=3696 RepID=A0A8T2Y9U7_POPDE|nr:hypothetical protein H0E87_016524 [Populus deltoides]
MDEDSKFVPLNEEDSAFGPPALLLLGFEVEEAVKIRELLKELDGEFLKVIFGTEDMIPRSLWEAMNTSQTNLETVKVGFLNMLPPAACSYSCLFMMHLAIWGWLNTWVS